jgi:hypothetical protein
MVTKPTDIANKWASSGTNTDPGAGKKATGWFSGEEPQFDFFNFWMNRIDQSLQCLNENGVFNWDSITSYPADAIVWYSGVMYISVAGGNQNHTPASNSTYWQVLHLPNIVVGNTQPTNGQLGNLWFNSATGVTYVCTVAYPTNTWVASGDSVAVQSSAPSTPTTGKLWYDTTATVLAMKVWDGAAWAFVDHSAIAAIGTSPPANPQAGGLWWNSSNGILYVYYNDGTSSQWVAVQGIPSTRPINEILHVQDQKSSGTDSGTFSPNTWMTRDLNTVVNNDITGASLAANQITLPAGKYEVSTACNASDVQIHKSRLRDVTNNTDLLYSVNEDVTASSGISSSSLIHGVVTLAGATVLELQHRCTLLRNTQGFGTPATMGIVEVYANVFIRKISN